MDDLQFNASLDALLESETLHGSLTADGAGVSNPYHVAASWSSLSLSLSSSASTSTASSSGSSNNSVPVLLNQAQQHHHQHQDQQEQPRSEGGQEREQQLPVQHASNLARVGTPLPPQSLPTGVERGSSGAAAGRTGGQPSPAPAKSGPTISRRGIKFPSPSSFPVAGGHKRQPPPAFSDAGSVSKPPPAAKKRVKLSDRDVSEIVSEDEDDRDKRRHERNLREQQRSQRITQQIEELRDVLAAANVQFKPDKYSTLVTVGEYIKQLQARAAILDSEHKKLIDTIAKTNQMVNSPYSDALTTPPPDKYLSNPDSATSMSSVRPVSDSDSTPYVDIIDYKNIFTNCGIPLAVASIDGRFMDCNKEFELITGFSRKEILPEASISSVKENTLLNNAVTGTSNSQSSGESGSTIDGRVVRNLSLFNLLCQDDMETVFLAMSEMLKQPGEHEIGITGTKKPTAANDHWSGVVRLIREPNERKRMNVSLVRSPKGRARFFDCALTSVGDAIG